MYEQLTIPICQNVKFTVSDFHVRLFRLLDRETDSEIHAGLSSLKSCNWLKNDTLKYYSEKMFQACSTMRGGGHSKRSSVRWENWGISWNGKFLTAAISESRKIARECSLLDIMEENPDEKYFLSDQTVNRLLSYKDTTVSSNTLKVGGNETVGTYPVDFEGGAVRF